MVFIEVYSCFNEPRQLIRLVIFCVCLYYTVNEVSECWRKIFHPPISTFYQFSLNDSIRYPTVTICKKPAFKKSGIEKYGLSTNYNPLNLKPKNYFENFDFKEHTLKDFVNDVTYPKIETIAMQGFNGTLTNPALNFSTKFYYNKGQCHIVNPLISPTEFSFDKGYLFLLLQEKADTSIDENGISTVGSDIFLHDPNEVLTDQSEQSDSFLEYIHIDPGEVIFIALNLQTYKQVSTNDNPCVSDESYSKSKCKEECLHAQLAGLVNCTLPWLRGEFNYPYCTNNNDVETIMTELRKGSSSSYLQTCQCGISCKKSVYSYKIISRKTQLDSNKSIIRIYYPSNLITTMEEILGYDWNSLLSDIGGSLGFLLGLSVIGFIEIIEAIFRILIVRPYKKKSPKKEAIGTNVELPEDPKLFKKLMVYFQTSDANMEPNEEKHRY